MTQQQKEDLSGEWRSLIGMVSPRSDIDCPLQERPEHRPEHHPAPYSVSSRTPCTKKKARLSPRSELHLYPFKCSHTSSMSYTEADKRVFKQNAIAEATRIIELIALTPFADDRLNGVNYLLSIKKIAPGDILGIENMVMGRSKAKAFKKRREFAETRLLEQRKRWRCFQMFEPKDLKRSPSISPPCARNKVKLSRTLSAVAA